MATLNGALASFVKNNDYTGFEREFLKLNPGKTSTDASASFLGHQNVLNSKTSSTTGNVISSAANSGGSVLSELVSADIGSKENLTGGLESLIKGVSGVISGDKGILGNIVSQLGNMVFQGTLGYLDKTSTLIEEVNSNLGLSGQLSEDFRKNIMEAWPDAERLGISFSDLTKGISNLVLNSGKFKILDTNSINNMSLASKFITDGIDGFSKLVSETEKYSIGINSTADSVKKIATDSISLGLNYKKVIDGVTGSLDMMYKYGFKNSIQGLADMSRKAIEFRMNMEDVGQFAEKVFKPEGALETVANLQMIGGAMGDLNDPLKLMYMTTNNIEGLQDSLINATKSLATYNKEQGKFEITGANLRRVREMADATGVSYAELSKISVAAAERSSAASDLMASGIQFTGEKAEETKEFITNLARMDNGKMVISIDSPELQKKLETTAQVALSDLTSEQAKSLFEYKKQLEKMSPEDIAKQQVSSLKSIDRNISFLAAKAQLELGKTESDVLKTLGFDPKDIVAGIDKTTDNIAKEIPKLGEEARIKIGQFVTEAKTFLGVGTPEPVNTTKKVKSKITPTTTTQSQNGVEKNNQQSQTLNVNHNVSVNSAMVDTIGRSLLKTTEDWKSYLHPYKIKNN